MKLSKKLEVTKEEFFDRLCFSVLEDIKKYSGSIRIKKGLQYTKKLSNGTTANVEISDYDYANLYEVKISTFMGTNVMKYRLENDSVIYEEKFYPKTLMYKLNYFLTSLIFYRKNKKKIYNLICMIENYVKENRK